MIAIVNLVSHVRGIHVKKLSKKTRLWTRPGHVKDTSWTRPGHHVFFHFKMRTQDIEIWTPRT